MRTLFFLILTLLITNFSQAQWEPDVRLTYDIAASQTTISSCTHAIAASGDTLHIVWFDDRDGIQEIYYKRSFDGGDTWEEDTRLTNLGYKSIYPAIAISGSTVHIAWIAYPDDPANGDIFYKRSTDGGDTWGEDTRLTETPGFTWAPGMAFSGSNLHLIYYDQWDNMFEIFYLRSPDGGLTWEPAVQLTDNSGGSYWASIAASGQMLHVAWYDSRDGNWEIYYKRSTDEGLSWDPDVRLTDDFSDSRFTCLGVSGSDIHVVWEEGRDGNVEIYYKSSEDDGFSWGPDTRLSFTSGQSICNNLAVAGDGLFLVWTDDTDQNKEIYYKMSLDGGQSWSQDTRLTYNYYPSDKAFITTSGSSIDVIWTDARDDNFEIYYKRDPSGNIFAGMDDAPPVDSASEMSIYPNPVSGQLTVGQLDSWTVGQSIVSLAIIDQRGNEILKFDTISLPNQIDVTGLKAGIYFLQFRFEDGKSRLIKFVKIDQPSN
jgi:hypothetical protein